jgi:hypothetical protein
MSELCTHLDEVTLHELPASVDGCEDCLREGSTRNPDTRGTVQDAEPTAAPVTTEQLAAILERLAVTQTVTDVNRSGAERRRFHLP